MEKTEQETVRGKQNYISSSQYKKISSTADRNETKDKHGFVICSRQEGVT